MSQALHGHHEVVTTHEVHHDEHHVHHHKETFITKYIFSQDHKTIAKQFLITGMIWAAIGGLMSVLFRLQLGYPDETFPMVGRHTRSLGKRRKDQRRKLLCFGYDARNCAGVLCINGWIERNLCKFPYSPTVWCKRYGITIFEYAFILVLFYGQCGDDVFIVRSNRSI